MSTRRHAMASLALGGLGVGGWSMQARAADLPPGTIRIVTPYPPGGTADVIARITAAELGAELNRNVVVDNKPGGNTNIGMREMLAGAPDGLTLLSTSTTILTNTVLYNPAPWKVEDFAPLNFTAELPYLLVVSPKLPVNSLSSLLEYASKRAPLNWGAPGAGGPSHLLTSKLAQVGGIKVNFIQYKGQPPILPDLVEGRLDAALLSSFSTLISLAKDGRLKPLAVFAEERIGELPNVATNAELGYPRASMSAWMGLFTRSNVPADIRARLIEACNKMVSKTEVRDKIRRASLVPGASMQADQLAKRFAADFRDMAQIIRDANIRLE
ncbi:MAG: tripartite tricarboxylate transporter substrate binding protein [Burkholderiaceae bacterium]|nr:tripartite tricarboxylate transporter substrate binding protein [Burkholderiaceae bacterium]MDP3136337.1 tripartite tricarboxylate transporter substrate binding protein [Burkholderiaceae bacterium]